MTEAEVNKILDDKSEPNQPLRLGSSTGTRPKVDPVEARERRSTMSALVMGGVSREQIAHTFAVKFGMSEDATRTLYAEVVEIWAQEDSDALKVSRGAARRRILNHIAGAAKDHKWTAVAGLEKVLSEVEGTIAPEIAADAGGNEARLTGAIMKMLGNKDPTEIRILIEKERMLIHAQTRAEAEQPRIYDLQGQNE